MYEYVPEKLGLVVEVKSRRKGKNGKTTGRRSTGERRNGKTGVVARVYDETGELIGKVLGTTFSDMSTKLRREWKVHPNVPLAKKGKTEI
jgi:hypothetical protein